MHTLPIPLTFPSEGHRAPIFKSATKNGRTRGNDGNKPIPHLCLRFYSHFWLLSSTPRHLRMGADPLDTCSL